MAKQTLDLAAIQINQAQLFQKRELYSDYEGYSLATWEQINPAPPVTRALPVELSIYLSYGKDFLFIKPGFMK